MEPRTTMTYLDHGATSYPKPDGVIEAYYEYAKNVGASPSRGGYATALEAGRLIFKTRSLLAQLFHVEDPSRIIFTKNATEALNLVFFGLLKHGDRVVTTRMEHNAVIRPLIELQRRGVIEVFWANSTQDARLDLDHLFELAKKPGVKLVVTTGICNATGVILPIREIGKFCREHDLIYLVDGAQLAGVYPVNVEEDMIDLLAFTGHKGLYGVPGTGGLYIGERVQKLRPLLFGGTGTRSDLETMPEDMPDRFEAGTPNTPGIVALGKGVEWVLSYGVDRIHEHKVKLLNIMHEGLKNFEGIRLFGPQGTEERTAIVPVIFNRLSPRAAAKRLWDNFMIAIRAGLHCAPHIHFDLGAPEGTARFSFGANNTEEDAQYAVYAIKEVAKESLER